ncbi:type II toxin-antitoxin system HipA family toxin [Persephonella sp.]
MKKKILATLKDKTIGELLEIGAETEFRYFTDNLKDSISISMPASHLTYRRHTGLIPFFDMFIPEGFLFEYLKEIIHKKEGKINDFIVLWYLAEGVKTKAKLKGREIEVKETQKHITMEELEENDSPDMFFKLLKMFIDKNAISGIQPKSLAVVKNKAQLPGDEYIVKTSGEMYPNLTEVEYFCLKVAKKSGLETPEFRLSKNKNFLIIKKFDKEGLFFEEAGSLLGKTRLDKYTGSYEQIAKIIKKYARDVSADLRSYFKMIVINTLIRNGDAHLKNFGLLFNEDFSYIRLSPAYDLICTSIYIKDDKPALTINGKHNWLNKKEMIKFGKEVCLLSEEEIRDSIDRCINAIELTNREVQDYIKENTGFTDTGSRMIEIWDKALLEFENKKMVKITKRRNNNDGHRFHR